MDEYIVKFDVPRRLIIDKGDVKVKYEAVFVKTDDDKAEIKFTQITEKPGAVFEYNRADVSDIITAINDAMANRYKMVWNGDTVISFE